MAILITEHRHFAFAFVCRFDILTQWTSQVIDHPIKQIFFVWWYNLPPRCEIFNADFSRKELVHIFLREKRHQLPYDKRQKKWPVWRFSRNKLKWCFHFSQVFRLSSDRKLHMLNKIVMEMCSKLFYPQFWNRENAFATTFFGTLC